MLTGTEHFSLSEVAGHTEWPIPAAYQDNAQATLEELETVRAILGVPLVLSSLWRSPSGNADTATAARASEHLTANAADFVPDGITIQEAAARWQAAVDAGQVPDFHQFIAEEASGASGAHIHYGRGTGQQTLVRLASGAYHDMADWLRGIGSAVVSAVETPLGEVSVAGVALAALLFRPRALMVGP